MKGQSVILTHTFLVGFGVLLVFIVIISFVSLHSDFQDFVTEKEMQQICFVIKDGLESLYASSDYRSPTPTVYGKMVIDLPDKIGGIDYGARFSNGSITIESVIEKYYCIVGINSTYYGATDGGATELVFWKNSTSDIIEMRGLS